MAFSKTIHVKSMMKSGMSWWECVFRLKNSTSYILSTAKVCRTTAFAGIKLGRIQEVERTYDYHYDSMM